MRPGLPHLLVLFAALSCAARARAQDAERDDGERLVLYGVGVGEYRLRVNFMNELPLSPEIPDPDGILPPSRTLGQEFWVDQWFRVRLEFGLRDRVRLVGETDAFDGLVVGQFTQGVDAADRAREAATAFPGIRPRALFVEWTPDDMKLIAGLVPVHWGLGIFDDDGAHEPPFGDYRYGDLMTRVGATFAQLAPLEIMVAGDLVFEDQLADVRDDDLAWRGVLGARYVDDASADDDAPARRELGLYSVYRHQRSDVTRADRDVADLIDAVTLDAYGRITGKDPGGGTVFAALEAAYTHSEVRVGGPVVMGDPSRDELAVVAQVGRTSGRTDVTFELGYASEGGLDRAVIHPDHHVGMLLFPEVIAWQSARAATLIRDQVLEGPVPAATPLVPTQGGVANAVYVQPVVTWRMSPFLRSRVGAVWAHAVTDVVDPYRRLEGDRANYRGGDAGNRDLGLELDAQIHAEGELSRGIVLSGGLEGAYLFPGHAFDDEDGNTMPAMGLFRVRMGLTF